MIEREPTTIRRVEMKNVLAGKEDAPKIDGALQVTFSLPAGLSSLYRATGLTPRMAARPSNREQARSFFRAKKPWSVQKDLILSNYLAPYLKKILHFMRGSALAQPVLIVDAFGGKGWFDDGNPGSPVHIIESADAVAAGRYTVTFGNEDPEQHAKLAEALKPYPHAKPRLDNSRALLQLVRKHVGERALFVFIDPFGVTNFEFDLIEPLIRRNKEGLSTEFLINFNVNDFHKKSARDSVQEKGIEGLDANTRSKIDGLNRVVGGDWWREFEYDWDLDAEVRSERLVNGYVQRLKEAGFQHVGYCSIQETDDAASKYLLIHGSRHIDALVLMNDVMGNAISSELHARQVKDHIPLFSGLTGDPEFVEWERGRAQAQADLLEIVPTYVDRYPGEARDELWKPIVEDYFLQFLKKEYRAAVKTLMDQGQIVVETSAGARVAPGTTRGLNEEARLFPVGR